MLQLYESLTQMVLNRLTLILVCPCTYHPPHQTTLLCPYHFPTLRSQMHPHIIILVHITTEGGQQLL